MDGQTHNRDFLVNMMIIVSIPDVFPFNFTDVLLSSFSERSSLNTIGIGGHDNKVQFTT